MPRPKKARRFDPLFPISAASIEVEAEYLRREVDNYAVLAPSDVETKRIERHANCQNTWKHLHLIMDAMPERDQRVLHALLFRDIWYVLELYRTYLHPIAQRLSPTPKVQEPAAPQSSAFSEWLFELPQGSG